ncbi:MAG: DUF3800 domain-containing protein [Duncaniella sp.]|nr:DUF3800 domain-containing protein [Duncaniella sp.]
MKLVAFFVSAMLYLCYIDESGTSQLPGNTSHYILCGVSLPVKYWKNIHKKINQIKDKYRLTDCEIHTGWILRKYREQALIQDFEKLSDTERRAQVNALRHTNLANLYKQKNRSFTQAKKNYKHTEPYIHLTYDERLDFLREIADLVGNSRYVRIFAECIDKPHLATLPHHQPCDEQALEQIVSRFEHYMSNIAKARNSESLYGLLVHDNNQTVSEKHTKLMQKFHIKGTIWTKINHVVETPFFVDSQLNNMVQIADLCALALRRYFENNEEDLLNRIISRFDRTRGKIVGVRHFSSPTCPCKICN